MSCYNRKEVKHMKEMMKKALVSKKARNKAELSEVASGTFGTPWSGSSGA